MNFESMTDDEVMTMMKKHMFNYLSEEAKEREYDFEYSSEQRRLYYLCDQELDRRGIV